MKTRLFGQEKKERNIEQTLFKNSSLLKHKKIKGENIYGNLKIENKFLFLEIGNIGLC